MKASQVLIHEKVDNAPVIIEAAAATKRGEHREVNQDSVYHRTGDAGALLMVCDGLGGHDAGEVASRLAVQTIGSALDEFLLKPIAAGDYAAPTTSILQSQLSQAVTEANTTVRNYSIRNGAQDGHPATTVTAALVNGDTAVIANAGDSRTYIYRDGSLRQITKDHSLTEKLIEAGIIAPGEEGPANQRNVILRALGIEDTVDVDLFTWIFKPGDVMLLCSDGLWKAFPDCNEITALLTEPGTAESICHQLVNKAMHYDGSDDTSAVVAIAK